MIPKIKNKAKEFLLRYQKYAKIDMLYAAASSFWNTASFGVTSVFSLVLTIVFANFLPKETYGTYKYIMSLSGALAFLTFSGMNIAVTQAVAQGYDGILPYAVKFQLKWNLFFLIVSTAFSGYYFMHGNSTLAASLLILGFAFPCLSAFNTYGAFLAGKKDFKRLSLWGMVIGGVYSLSMIVAILFLKKIVFLVLAYSLGNVLPQVYFYFRTLKVYRTKPSNRGQEKELLKFGGHLSFMNIFSNLSQYVDKIVVFHFLGAVQLAVYGLALAIPERIRGYTKSYGSLILPKLSGRTMPEIRPVFYKRSFQGMAMGALISLGYIVVAPFAFHWFLPKYLEAIRYSQVLSLSLAVVVAASYQGTVFQAQKMVRTIYISSLSAHISRSVLFVLFGYLWGIWGVIYASLLVYALGFFLNLILWELEVKKHKKLIASEISGQEILSNQSEPVSID